MADSIDMKEIWLSRLKTLGAEPEFLKGLLNAIANVFVQYPNINLDRINLKLQSLGWLDIKIDYRTFAIAEAILNQPSKNSQANN